MRGYLGHFSCTLYKKPSVYNLKRRINLAQFQRGHSMLGWLQAETWQKDVAGGRCSPHGRLEAVRGKAGAENKNTSFQITSGCSFFFKRSPNANTAVICGLILGLIPREYNAPGYNQFRINFQKPTSDYIRTLGKF